MIVNIATEGMISIRFYLQYDKINDLAQDDMDAILEAIVPCKKMASKSPKETMSRLLKYLLTIFCRYFTYPISYNRSLHAPQNIPNDLLLETLCVLDILVQRHFRNVRIWRQSNMMVSSSISHALFTPKDADYFIHCILNEPFR
jgi:hypothetical protein